MGSKQKSMTGLVVLFLLSVSAVAQPGNDCYGESVTVDDVIGRFVSACGGDALGFVKTERRTGILLKGSAGKVPFESVSTASGQWYYNQVFAFGDQVSYGCDDGDAWVADQHGVVDIDRRELLDLLMLFDIQMPLRLRTLFPELKIKHSTDEEDAGNIVVSACSVDGIRMELVFEEMTGLLIRAGDLYFSDYREAGPVVRPHQIFIGEDPGDGLRLQMQVNEIVFDGPVGGTIFSRPGCSLKRTKAPLYTRRKQITVSAQVLDTLVGRYSRVDKPDQVITIKRQDNHLMMKTFGSPYFIEIKPESELDYFIRFLNLEVHFVKNKDGDIIRLELGPERRIVAIKMISE
jgi:hypothetical protein